MNGEPPLNSAALLKEVMASYQAGAGGARAGGIPVVWVTAVFPVEIVYALGLFPYYPENFGALASTRRAAEQLSRAAEARGYYPDLCGYARCGLGDSLGEEHPVGRLERPDLILASNAQCGSLAKWFQAAAQWYDVPYFLLDTPSICRGTREQGLRYFKEQLLELITFLEKATGRELDYARLEEVLGLATRASSLWGEILEMAALRPAPLSFFDACVHMAPIVTLRGAPEAVQYYSALKKELQERQRLGLAAVPGERYKLYWDHLPVWPRLRYFSDFFAARGALVACSQYVNSWIFSFDQEDPIGSLAENYSAPYVNQDFLTRLELKVALMRRFQVDGFVLFSNRSCKPNSLGLYDKRRLLSERTGLPGVILEADMADLRYFSRQQVEERLEFFLEQVGARPPGQAGQFPDGEITGWA